MNGWAPEAWSEDAWDDEAWGEEHTPVPPFRVLLSVISRQATLTVEDA